MRPTQLEPTGQYVPARMGRMLASGAIESDRARAGLRIHREDVGADPVRGENRSEPGTGEGLLDRGQGNARVEADVNPRRGDEGHPVLDEDGRGHLVAGGVVGDLFNELLDGQRIAALGGAVEVEQDPAASHVPGGVPRRSRALDGAERRDYRSRRGRRFVPDGQAEWVQGKILRFQEIVVLPGPRGRLPGGRAENVSVHGWRGEQRKKGEPCSLRGHDLLLLACVGR
jgi:hypothetical protein